MSEKPIGVFDSGIGGLTVVKEIFRVLPSERIVYYGDTARIPYGSKSRETVLRFSWEIAKFLRNLEVKLLVVACNTASALALPSLAAGLDIPILGVIDAGARGALTRTRSRRLGVIGTEATIASRAYAERLTGIDPGATVFAASCPLFVPLAEEGWIDRDVTREVARIYLAPLLAERIDTLILGCTHYPLLKGVISEVAGTEVALVDSAEETARDVARVLERDGLTAPAGAPGGAVYYVSDSPERFLREAVRFLGRPVESVTWIEQSDVPWYERVSADFPAGTSHEGTSPAESRAKRGPGARDGKRK